MRHLILLVTLLMASCSPKQEAAKQPEEKDKTDIQPMTSDMQTPEGGAPWIDAYREGINFIATGNEPFWNLQMDFDKAIRFDMLDGPEISLPPVEPILAQDANVRLYRGTSESGTLEITIQESRCQDTMADIVRPFQVRIRYKAGDAADFSEVQGCGNYVTDPRLHNIWAVTDINDKELDTDDYPQGLPRLELYTSEGRVMGFDGCNTFRGMFYERDSLLYFSPMASTKMACRDVADDQVTALFSSKRFSYSWEANKLILTAGGNRVELRNID